MNELRAIVEAYRTFADEGKRSVLLTLVDVEGSSNRRPGARMLVDEEGQVAGFIGGGCLEGDLVEHAGLVLESGQARTISYDLSESGELEWGLGVGCPGKIFIFVESVDDGLAARLGEWARLSEPILLITVYDAGEESRFLPGDRWVISSDGSMDGPPPDDPIAEPVHREGLAVLKSGQSVVRQFGEGPAVLKTLMEYLAPSLRLVVSGSGQDAAALMRQAVELGWDATIIDPAAGGDGARRYPEEVHIHTAETEGIFEDLEIDARTAVVLMSHHFQRDRALLNLLAQKPTPYVGLLGATSRRDLLISELTPENRKSLKGRLYAPVGLDIGGDRPAEIAMSVVAEIQAVFSGRSGGYLRDRKRSIHDRGKEKSGRK